LKKWLACELDEEDKPIPSSQQEQLNLPRGLAIPFNKEESEKVKAQFLRVTISGGCSYSFWENPEVVQLLMMFRSTASDVIPSWKVLSGYLLNEAAEKVGQITAQKMKNKELGLL
jgi:hypothetical protein